MVETDGNSGERFTDEIAMPLMAKRPVWAEPLDQKVLWIAHPNVIVVEAPSAALVQLGGPLHPDGLVGPDVVELMAPTLETTMLGAVVG